MSDTATTDTYPYGERRLTRRLMRYWQDQRFMRPMPEESDIDPDVLGEDWLYCFMVQARDVGNTQDYNFVYLGDKISEAYCDAESDAFSQFMVGPNAKALAVHMQRVVDSQAPVLDEGEFTTMKGRRVLYRQCLLPLGTDEGEVKAVFGGMNYKVVG